MAYSHDTRHRRGSGPGLETTIAPTVGQGIPHALQSLLLHVQRTAGNQAVNRLLERHGLTSVVQRQALRPVIQRDSDDDSSESAPSDDLMEPQRETAHIVPDELIASVRTQALKDFVTTDRDMFANLWLTAATTALAGAPEPEDSESTLNWWVALLGNLLWAATSFVAPEAVGLIRLMSLEGAAIGSGVLAGPQEKAPSGKELIGSLLTKTRDGMVQTAERSLDDAATECGNRQITDPEEQRKVLWRMLFKTPYNLAEPIRAQMNVKIQAGLAQYQQQWHAWDDEIKRLAMDKAMGSDAKQAVKDDKDEDVVDLVKDIAGAVGDAVARDLTQAPLGMRYLRFKEQLRKEKPFRPNLSFGD